MDRHANKQYFNLPALLKLLVNIINHPLNKKRKFKSVMGFLKWQVGSRLVPGKIIYQWVGDTRFIVSPGEHGLTQNIYYGLQEFSDMAYILHVLEKGDLFVDVGANVGSYTILACGVKKAFGYCFEPVPTTFSRLMDNLKLNELCERVKAFNLGVAEKNGHLLFTADKNTANHIVADGQQNQDVIKVDVVALDSILENEDPSVIKLDVEGFETLVVEGATKTIQKPSLHSVIMELIGNGAKHGFNEGELFDTMLSFGFQAYTYEPFTRKLVNVSKLHNRTSGNIIFCKNPALVKRRLERAPVVIINDIEL